MKKIITFGVYDLLHLGHILLFKHAKEQGDYLTVAVQEDCSILKYKPNASIINNTELRQLMVASIRYVDEVVTYKDVDIDIKKYDFDILVKGPDQIHNGFMKAEQWCNDNGKTVITIPRTEGISSSMIRELLNDTSKMTAKLNG